MTADDRFNEIWHKIERANKHISDLDAALRRFMASEPYKIECRRDQSRKPIYYIKQIEPVPTEIILILGDAIQNLRTALDHLAQQLYLVGTQSSTLARHISFFIGSSASDYRSNFRGRVNGMRRDAIDAICALEPFKAGKGHQLWVLNSLNNIDKHRALVACGGSFQALDILAAVLPAFPPQFRAAFAGTKQSLLMNVADKLCPLKVGDELFIGTPDDEFNPDLPFHLAVALNEPDITEPGPMREAVQALADSVSNSVNELRPFLI